MDNRMSWKNTVWHGLWAGVMGLALFGFAGCASDQPMPSAKPGTRDQVRGHADKAFDSLKQEEKRPASESGGSMY
ncbi:MAG: hypothetical protein OEY86_08315 [Nitrospira sp.]|nr:hypothetical protein [Nitrospira sp.]